MNLEISVREAETRDGPTAFSIRRDLESQATHVFYVPPVPPTKLQRDAARNIVTKYLQVRAGENAIIESWNHTMPMATAMVDEVRRVGGHAVLIHENEDAWWRAIDRKQSRLLGQSSGPEWAALKAADVYVNFWGPGDTDRIEKLSEKTFDEALAWNSPWYEVARKANLRGGRMTAAFVTEGRARKWGLDRGQWEENVWRACLISPDELARTAARLAKVLSRGRKVRITHSNGTDLEVALAGVAPLPYDGRPHPRDKKYGQFGMLTQIPGGNLDVALDSKTAEGTFHANRRTNIWWTVHSGGKLELTDGKLSSYSFEHGGEEFARQY
ncbi:MAG: aminopeptidase [Thermoplasmata archaeon]|jgi:leucyl aminopeptidase (aminopeptidase T)|nr:aminopeptidase [Thermoplasmata archaeon]